MASDWATMRADMIKAHGIRRADDKFTFFYDETNFEEHKNFVLGGIALQEGQAMPEIESLRDALGIQDNAPEIKFKHVPAAISRPHMKSQSFTRNFPLKDCNYFFPALLENAEKF